MDNIRNFIKYQENISLDVIFWAGFIINRFRGDIELFTDGVRWIEEKTGKKVFGVIHWYDHIHIESEDSVVIESPAKIKVEKGAAPAIAVIRLPHISNFTDFDPLSNTEGLDLHFIQQVQGLSGFAAVILPGSKNTCFDLRWLRSLGWTDALRAHADNNGHILGICGGYQMMSREVQDADGLEGPPEHSGRAKTRARGNMSFLGFEKGNTGKFQILAPLPCALPFQIPIPSAVTLRVALPNLKITNNPENQENQTANGREPPSLATARQDGRE